jgi:hypothetical protein
MAAGAYPFLSEVDPRVFTRTLAGELAVGGLLLAGVPPLADAVLTQDGRVSR